MNNDLISRSALLEALNKLYMAALRKTVHSVETIYELDHLSMLVNDAPAVDAEVVRHGRYGFVGPHIGSTYSPYAEHGTCSECKERILIDSQHKNYCPNCGAKMRGDDGASE